jgi:hypothetical protein
MSRKPNEYEIQAALDFVWGKYREIHGTHRQGERAEEISRSMWMELSRDQVALTLEFAWSDKPRIYTLDEHLTGYAPGNLKHHLAFDHQVRNGVFQHWDPEGWEAIHRRAHAEGQTHAHVRQP